MAFCGEAKSNSVKVLALLTSKSFLQKMKEIRLLN